MIGADIATQPVEAADITIDALVLSGDPIPGSSATLVSFGDIDLDGDTVTFQAKASDSDDGLFQVSEPRMPLPVVREGDVAPGVTVWPDGATCYFSKVPAFPKAQFYHTFSANPSGTVVLSAGIGGGQKGTLWLCPAGSDPILVAGGNFNLLWPTERITVSSGVTGVSYTGRLVAADLDFPAIHHSGAIAFFGSVNPEDPQAEAGAGLFIRSGSGHFRNVFCDGDPVPGYTSPGMYFGGGRFTWTRRSVVEAQGALQDDGTVYFLVSISEAYPFDVEHPPIRTFWRGGGGALELIAEEGGEAPGLPGRVLEDLQLHPVDGSRVILGAQAEADGETVISGYWAGASEADLHPIFLTVPGGPTTTDLGDVAFTMLLDPLVAPNGDFYLHGTGDLDAERVSGIWRRDAKTGAISQVVAAAEYESGVRHGPHLFSHAYPLAVSSNNDLAFVARSYSDLSLGLGSFSWSSLWVLTADGQLVKILDEMDGLSALPLSTIDFDTVQFNEESQLALSMYSTIDDSFIEGIFLVSFTVPPPGGLFAWAGECDASNWHCGVLNWDDAESGEDAALVPGSAVGTEGVTIGDAAVVISDAPVHLAFLTATGSLAVDQAVTLEQTSYIEDLTLRADLVANGELSLAGRSEWFGGSLAGDGEVQLLPGGELEISPTLGSCDLHLPLEVGGEVTQESVTLNLQGEFGKVTILSGGCYLIQTGSIVDFTPGGHVLNEGDFTKSTT